MKNTQPKRILVVDDQPNWRELLTEVLGGKGYQVKAVECAEEAKAFLNNQYVDLAILDMRLIDDQTGNLEGMRLLREVKALHPTMKAVILTGYSEEKQKIKALDYYKADGYFEKAPGGQPIEIDNFAKAIVDLLE